MKTGFKQIVALLLALLLAASVCAFGEEEAENKSLRRVRLGSSVYTVMIDDDFIRGEMTEDDIANGQIACFQNDETGLDFDVYQIDKDEEIEDLPRFTILSAYLEDEVEVIWPADTINDIDAGWYWATRTQDGVKNEVAVYILDSGDTYLELVFWPSEDDVGMEILDIMDSLQYMALKEISLGTSNYHMVVPDDYVTGAISDEDVADDQVAYWYSDASPLDFDVYQFSKEGEPEALAEYAEKEAAMYEGVSELVTDGEINLINVASYRAVEECDEGEYDTLTYIIDGGDQYVEVVFWLDGPTANAEADFIINNLFDASMQEGGADDVED